MGYAKDTYDTLRAVTEDSGVASDLSPSARALLSVYRTAVDTQLAGDPSKIAESALSAALNAGVQLTRSVLLDVAAKVAPELVGAIAGVVPLFGTVIDLIMQYSGSAAAAPPNAEQLLKNAMSQYKAVGLGTGPGGAVMPCDLFVFAPPGNVGPMSSKNRTSLGLAFAQVTEMTGETYEARKKSPKVGVSAERQKLFRRMRLGIEAAWRPAGSTDKSDGGVALWGAYVDLLRAEFNAGRLNAAYAHYLLIGWNGFSPGVDRNVTRAFLGGGAAAAKAIHVIVAGQAPWGFRHLWDTRCLQMVTNAEIGWAQTIASGYVQHANFEQQALAAAAAMAAKKKGTSKAITSPTAKGIATAIAASKNTVGKATQAATTKARVQTVTKIAGSASSPPPLPKGSVLVGQRPPPRSSAAPSATPTPRLAPPPEVQQLPPGAPLPTTDAVVAAAAPLAPPDKPKLAIGKAAPLLLLFFV